MFERSLIVSQQSHASAEQRWTAAASITLQIALAGLIVGAAATAYRGFICSASPDDVRGTA